MEYTRLTKEEQKQLLEGRLKQFEMEHYGHVLNKAQLTASGDQSNDTKQAIANADKSLTVLDKAHAEVLKELAKLDAEPKPEK